MNRSKINSHYVYALTDLLRNSSGKHEQTLRFLKIVISDHMWKCLFVRELRRKVTFHLFEEFVQAPPPEGLGTSVQKLKELCAHNEHVAKLIERQLNRKNGLVKSLKTT
jgi:hypothetical protein